MRLDHLLSMEKSGEKLNKSFCQNGLLARQADKEVLGRFAEQTHEYNEVVRMVFRRHFQRKVVKDIHCSVLKDQTFKTTCTLKTEYK